MANMNLPPRLTPQEEVDELLAATSSDERSQALPATAAEEAIVEEAQLESAAEQDGVPALSGDEPAVAVANLQNGKGSLEQQLDYLSGETTAEVQTKLTGRMSLGRAQEVARKEIAAFNAAEAERSQALSDQQLSDIEGKEQTGDGPEAASEELTSNEEGATSQPAEAKPAVSQEAPEKDAIPADEELIRQFAHKIEIVDDAVTSFMNDKSKKVGGLLRARKAALVANGLDELAKLPPREIDAMFKAARERSHSWRDDERAAVAEDVAEAIGSNAEVRAAIEAKIKEARDAYVKEHKSLKGFRPGDTIAETVKSLVKDGTITDIEEKSLDVLDGYVAKGAWNSAFRPRQAASEAAAAPKKPSQETKEKPGEADPAAKPEKSRERAALEKEAYDSIVADLVALESYDFNELLEAIDAAKASAASNPEYKGKATYGRAAEALLKNNFIGNYDALRAHGNDVPLVSRDKIVQAIKEAKRQRALLPPAEHETSLQEIGRLNGRLAELDAERAQADNNGRLKLGAKMGRVNRRIQELSRSITGNEQQAPGSESNQQRITELESNIAALRQQYGNLPDKNVPKGQQIVAEIRTLQAEIASLEALDQQQIDDAFNSLADKLDLKQQGDNTIEEPSDEELKALLAELSVDELNTRYESLEAKLQTLDGASDEANELRKQLSDIYEVKARKELAEAGQNGTTVETLQAEAADLQRQYAAIPDGERNSDQAKELQAKIIEKLNGVYEKLEEEYNAIPHESKRRTGDNLTPEQEQLAVRADELRKRLSDVYAEIAKAKLGEIVAPPTAEEQQRAQREREIRAAAETRIRDEAFVKYERVYRTALDEYAKLRAENERKAEGLFPGIGRKKREVALSEAREKLQNAKLEYERFIVTAKREAGLYEGDEAAIAAAQSNELFEGLLSLDEQARTETLKIHEERAENRNKFQKFFVGVGKFLSKGNRFIRAAKTMGIGLATGAAVKGGLGAIAGSTLPVSLAAGGILVSASLGVRYGATQHNLDISRAEEAADKNAEGVVSRRLSDEQIAKLKTVLEGATAADIKQRQSTLAGNVLQESETNSKKKIDEARKKAGRTATMFGLSAAAGGIGAHIAQNGLPDIFSGHDAQAKPGDPPTKPGDPTGQNVPHDVEGRRQALEELKNAEKTGGGLDAKGELNLKGNSFFVESGNGPIKEIQQAAKLNGHDISIGRAEEIYDKLYDKYGDKLVSGGPEYHGPNGDLRFGESGKYKWGNGVLEKIVTMAAK